ncbi:MAG: DUF2914 domain-containing protein [Patescibacteria group bacterium]
MIKHFWGKVKSFYDTHERHLGIGLMLFGFGVDNLTFNRIDLLLDNLIIAWYLLVALACIIVINLHGNGRLRHPLLQKISPWAPIPMQIVFGGLFSAFTVIYWRSSSILTRWPFLAILVLLLVGNEFAKSRYAKFTFHVTVFYTAVFFYAILIVPVMVKQMGPFIFVVSGLVSLLAIAFVLLLLKILTPDRWVKSKRHIAVSITGTFAAFNVLYFTNIIPPVPLALKTIGVYHDLQTKNTAYDANVEPPPWYQFYFDTSRTFHRYNNERVYVFSAVFAPTNLANLIYHRWSRYHETTKQWTTVNMLSYPIIGGRDGGYRGFSYKQNIGPGLWRVDVLTRRNQLVGRIKFAIVESPTVPVVKAVKL